MICQQYNRYLRDLAAPSTFLRFSCNTPTASSVRKNSWHHHMARQPEQSLIESERVIRLDPYFHWGHYFLSWAAEGLGDTTRAVDAARAAMRCMPTSPVMHALLGRALAVAGDRSGARAVSDAIARDDPAFARYGYEAALIHLGMGDHDKALDLLAHARDRRSGWLIYAHIDPRLDALRTDPRFVALLPLRAAPPAD